MSSRRYITKAPPPRRRPRCPNCGEPLRPAYRVETWGVEKARSAGFENPYIPAVRLRYPDEVTFVGYQGPEPFCTKTCATHWAVQVYTKRGAHG